MDKAQAEYIYNIVSSVRKTTNINDIHMNK